MRPFAHRVMLVKIHLFSVPGLLGGPHDGPFFQPKSSPISRPMKPRRSQSHIPNCALCCSKSSAADTQWKIPDMCKCEGVVLRQCDLIIRYERRLALGTTWCEVNLYFVRSCLEGTLYRSVLRYLPYDTCMFMVIDYRTYLCIFSAVLARLCKFYGVANRCIYSAECDGCACRECHIHCPTRWCESCH